MTLVHLTPSIVEKIGIKRSKLKEGIDNGTIKGQKISERIYMIDDALVPKDAETPATSQDESPSSSSASEAKNNAEVALHELKRTESDIKRKLIKEGYESVEQALAGIAKQNKDLQYNIEALKSREDDLTEEHRLLLTEKKNVSDYFAKLKVREIEASARLEEANAKIQEASHKLERYETLKVELTELVKYHNDNIKPCSQTLSRISKAIYQWLEPLNETKYDFTKLHNYICSQTEVLERYVERVTGLK